MSCERTAELFWPPHDPDEQLDYDLDFTDALPAADTIITAVTTIVPSADPLDLDEVSTTIDPAGKIVTVWLKDGVAGTSYEVRILATTSNAPARIINRTVNIKAKEQ